MFSPLTTKEQYMNHTEKLLVLHHINTINMWIAVHVKTFILDFGEKMPHHRVSDAYSPFDPQNIDYFS